MIWYQDHWHNHIYAGAAFFLWKQAALSFMLYKQLFWDVDERLLVLCHYLHPLSVWNEYVLSNRGLESIKNCQIYGILRPEDGLWCREGSNNVKAKEGCIARTELLKSCLKKQFTKSLSPRELVFFLYKEI